MLYLNRLILASVCLFMSGCSLLPTFGPSGPTNEKINNSAAVHRATMRPYTINGKTYYPTVVSVGDRSNGIASWYGPNFHGKKTSNGEIYNMHNMTAANKTLPMNTIVKVTNLNNNREVIVRINDRGPFVANRIIDLSKAAASQINMIATGTAPVKLEVIGFNAKVMTNSHKNDDTANIQMQDRTIVGGDFMVQIGAFKNQNGANRYKNEHQNFMGYSSLIKTYVLDGESLYRVFLSGFRSEEEARDFAKSGHFSGAFIVRGW